MVEKKYDFWLCQIKNLRRSSIKQLWKMKKSAKAVYELSEKELQQCSFLTQKEKNLLIDAQKDKLWQEEWNQIGEKNVRVITFLEEEYPQRLRHISSFPKCLYVKGKMPREDAVSIGIVGARDCTVYGRDIARMFAYRLAQQGVQIISGMAKGIDGWGHQGALEAGGDTYAILGTGVEVCYPSSHEALYRSIQKHGGIISEFPIHAKAMPQFFPLRNRIISGLSDGILVVEAREKSGSLITADAALEQGKDVFVIPGRIGDSLSVGCNRLIRQGAMPVLEPQDILSYYHIKMPEKKVQTYDACESYLLSCMQIQPVHIDSIIADADFSPTEVMKGLIHLCKQKEIEEVGRGYYHKKL